MTPGGALVLGANYPALGVARSLGRRGVPVDLVTGPDDPVMASVSRYARKTHRWPGGDEAARVEFLHGLGSNGRAGWALIPADDETAAMIARNHATLEGPYTHTVPQWDVLRWAYDKRLSYEIADRVGVRRPVTARVASAAEAASVDVPFPIALKPAVKVEQNALTAMKAWRVERREDLERRFAEAQALVGADVLMIQEIVPGGGEMQFSYAALCRDGEPLATLVARRTRQYPAEFGRASTFVETVECPDIAEPSERLIREMGYTGLIELEYKRDPRDGELKLLDMNPRVWGWLTLCGAAGVDFPWLLWLFVSGADVPAPRQEQGVRWLRLTTDTPTAWKQVIRRRLPVREYARSLRRPRESAIFAWDDPMPGLTEVPVLAYVAARRLLRRGTV
jgi:D-aspartate ligase